MIEQIIPPPTSREAVIATLSCLPERVQAGLGTVNIESLMQVLNADAKDMPGAIDAGLFLGIDPFIQLAKKTKKTRVEYYALIAALKDEFMVGIPREGYYNYMLTDAYPKTENAVGSLHTHPNETAFSHTDTMAFIVSPLVLMATLSPKAQLNVLIKIVSNPQLANKIAVLSKLAKFDYDARVNLWKHKHGKPVDPRFWYEDLMKLQVESFNKLGMIHYSGNILDGELRQVYYK